MKVHILSALTFALCLTLVFTQTQQMYCTSCLSQNDPVIRKKIYGAALGGSSVTQNYYSFCQYDSFSALTDCCLMGPNGVPYDEYNEICTKGRCSNQISGFTHRPGDFR